MKRNILMIIGAILVTGTVMVLVATAQPAQDSQEEEPALEEFVPSEELPADSAISLPVDI